MDVICDVTELEHVVGSRMLPVMMKSIDRLDPHCDTLLSRSPAAVLGYVDTDGKPRASLIGGTPGFATPKTPTHLNLPLPPDAAPDKGAALLVLLPGWRETLRINGTVTTDGLTVEEAFLHCGKAIIRSNLWAPTEKSTEDTDFLATAPFAVITSSDSEGNADASPKGDPHVIRQISPTTIAIADRPGNRRTDTFHNIVDHPEVAIVALAPGDNRTLELTGTAKISADPDLRASMSERNRIPKAVLLVEVADTRLAHSDAITTADLWNPAHHLNPAELPRPSAIWADHVKLNETKGLAAKAVRKMITEPLTRAGTALDYRQNLY